MAEREQSVPVVSDDSVACLSITAIVVTFVIGGVVLLSGNHDSGLILLGAGFAAAYLLLF